MDRPMLWQGLNEGGRHCQERSFWKMDVKFDPRLLSMAKAIGLDLSCFWSWPLSFAISLTLISVKELILLCIKKRLKALAIQLLWNADRAHSSRLRREHYKTKLKLLQCPWENNQVAAALS
jgi:hypothetical protein